jgi:plastocyanin
MKTLIYSKGRALVGSAFIIAILTIMNSCSKSTDYNTPGSGSNGGPGANEVWMKGMAFTPATITVKAGTTIKWTNKDNTPHTVTSDAGSLETFDSGSIANGGTFSWQFSTTGTFTYTCTFHPGMKGTVIVN